MGTNRFNIHIQGGTKLSKYLWFVIFPCFISPNTSTYYSYIDGCNTNFFMSRNKLYCLCAYSLCLFCCFQIDRLKVLNYLSFVRPHSVTDNAADSSV